MELKRGDLIRWVFDHDIYEAFDDVLRGLSPNYKHGITIEVSDVDTDAVMVFCYDCGKKREGSWMILSVIDDRLEVLSGASGG